jgi:hypothetical protein
MEIKEETQLTEALLLAEVGLAAVSLAVLVQVALVLAAVVVVVVPPQVEMAGVGVWEMGVLAARVARLAQMEIRGTQVAAVVRVVVVVLVGEMVELELLVVGEEIVKDYLED